VIDTRSLKGVRGFLIDAPERGRLRATRDGALLVEDGVIVAAGPFDDVRRAPGADGLRWMHAPECVVVPGLIDLHTHLPQYPVVARCDGDCEGWAKRHATPVERHFRGAAARQEAPHFFEELARHGTTCAMLQTTVHEDGCEVAFEAGERSGLRVIAGKTLKDTGAAPVDKSADAAIERSERLCRKWHGGNGGRLDYAFSPDSPLACSAGLLREAGEKARACNAYFQIHLLHGASEGARFLENFPAAPHATDLLLEAGVLDRNLVLSACAGLCPDEIELLAATGAAVAHTPTSDLALARGILSLDRLLDAGVRVGLGSDVAAGPELDLWRVMRSAIESQRARSFYETGVRVPSPAEVFHLATLGGACALGKEAHIGTLDIGREADFVALDLAQVLPDGTRGNMHSDLSAEDVIALLVHRGGPQAVIETFVRGTSVYRAPAPMLL
jgi:guanine deaminase